MTECKQKKIVLRVRKSNRKGAFDDNRKLMHFAKASSSGAIERAFASGVAIHYVKDGQHINPDDIARHIDLSATLDRALREVADKTKWPLISSALSDYFSALLAQTIATGLRKDWLGYKLSLTYESVMSHERHLDFAEITPDGYLDIFEKQFNKAQPTWFTDHLLKKWSKQRIRIASF